MHIKINGKTHEFLASLNVRELAEHLSLDVKQVAIERNRQIVPRSRWNEEAVADGDEIEIVRFIGGG